VSLRKMKSLVLILVSLVILVVNAADEPSTCQWRTIDPVKDVPPEVAAYASENLITSFAPSPDSGVRVSKINKAKVQTANGKNYDLEIIFEFTSCSASRCYDDINDPSLCATKSSTTCTIKVYHQPWSYTLSVIESECVA